MRRPTLFLLATLLLVHPGARSAQVMAQGGETYSPTATIKDLMIMMVDPSADFIWESVATEVSAAGIRSRSPQNDKEWEELRKRTLMLIETTNLLAIPGRHVARAGEKAANPQTQLEPEQIETLINQDRPAWVSLSLALRDATVKTLTAVDAKDVSGLLKAGAASIRRAKTAT